MDPAPTNPTAAPATRTAPTLWRQGAGVGTAVAGGLSAVIALGLGQYWLPQNGPANYVVPTVTFVAGTLLGALCGAVIGWAVPVAETRLDKTAYH